jgi:hypothetical protein
MHSWWKLGVKTCKTHGPENAATQLRNAEEGCFNHELRALSNLVDASDSKLNHKTRMKVFSALNFLQGVRSDDHTNFRWPTDNEISETKKKKAENCWSHPVVDESSGAATGTAALQGHDSSSSVIKYVQVYHD